MPVYTLSDSSSGSQFAANGEHLTAVQTAQDNPVGIIKKSIYVIKNIVNDKVYVGQSSDPKRRFIEHIQEAKRGRKSTILVSAMQKHGVDKFYMELLESDIENYNEMEIYWITKLNSIAPSLKRR